jgi:ADP-ribose pyrophosphatase
MTKKIKRKVVYRGAVFNVEEWKLPKTGSRFSRITGNDAVVILALMKNRNMLIEKQYRHTLDKYLYEIPAGAINKGEKPRTAAIRELEEETGYFAKKMTFLFKYHGSAGSHTQMLHVYLAEDLKKTKKNLDKEEVIEVMEMSIGKVLQMIRSHKITDAKVMVALLYYLHFIKK